MADLIFQHTNNARMLFDFGLLVLIWLVQLIIYPSFRYISAEHFQSWHSQYTLLISIVVMPLMLGQVALIGIQIFNQPNWAVYASAALVALIWLSTFIQVVPIHNLLTAGQNLSGNVERLITMNWPRTIMWTLTFGLSFFKS